MRKRLLFADESGLFDAIRFVQQSAQEELEIFWLGGELPQIEDSPPFRHIRTEAEFENLADHLRMQPMGTQVDLFLAGQEWKKTYELCLKIGFSSRQIFGEAYGPVRERVFCIGCYGLNPPAQEAQLACQHCGRVLSVSSHYSRRLDAVIGYLTMAQSAEEVPHD